MKAQIDALLNKEMTRKEFLQHIGAAFLILIGISGLVSALLKQQGGSRRQTAGYGVSAYGGARRQLQY